MGGRQPLQANPAERELQQQQAASKVKATATDATLFSRPHPAGGRSDGDGVSSAQWQGSR